MLKANVQVQARPVKDGVHMIDISGEVNAAAEHPIMDAYTVASTAGARVIILNFTGLNYMNSTGIGLLVTLLIRVSRQRQKLLAFGLSEHYRQIFKLTRLDEAISLYESEAEALEAAGRG